jgi:hypothetical protein
MAILLHMVPDDFDKTTRARPDVQPGLSPDIGPDQLESLHQVRILELDQPVAIRLAKIADTRKVSVAVPLLVLIDVTLRSLRQIHDAGTLALQDSDIGMVPDSRPVFDDVVRPRTEVELVKKLE